MPRPEVGGGERAQRRKPVGKKGRKRKEEPEKPEEPIIRCFEEHFECSELPTGVFYNQNLQICRVLVMFNIYEKFCLEYFFDKVIRLIHLAFLRIFFDKLRVGNTLRWDHGHLSRLA